MSADRVTARIPAAGSSGTAVMENVASSSVGIVGLMPVPARYTCIV